MKWNAFRIQRAVVLTGPVLLLLSAALFTGCGGGGKGDGGSVAATTRTASVSVVGMSFGDPITVASGTVVTWKNNSGLPHNIVWDSHDPSDAPGPGSNIGTFEAGSSTTWAAPTVTKQAVYAYHCGIHGPMMSSTITVTP